MGRARVNESPLEREIDKPAYRFARECWNLPQQQLAAGRRLQERQHVVDGRIRLVDLVEKQEPRNFLILQLAQNELQLRNFLLIELANHHRGIDRRQGRAHLMYEFDGARTIDESVIVAHEIRAGDGDLHAHLVVARLLAGIAYRVSRLDRPCRWIAPVRARIASSKVVLPLWNGPTSAMHRGPVARVPFCAISPPE